MFLFMGFCGFCVKVSCDVSCVLLQVSEAELEAIARMGDGAAAMEEELLGAGGEATRQLLGQYGQTPAK